MSTLAFSIGLVNANRHGLRAPKGGCTVGGKLYRGGQFCLPYDIAYPHGEPTPAPTRLAIFGFVYTVAPIPVAAECGTVAFELHRLDTNNRYHVVRDGFGEVSCTCPDFEFRRSGTGQPCKHGRALIAAGLIEPTAARGVTPVTTPRVLVAAMAQRPEAPARKPELKPLTLERTRPIKVPPAHRKPFVPTPEEIAEANALFADASRA